jgi:hypothetical protein
MKRRSAGLQQVITCQKKSINQSYPDSIRPKAGTTKVKLMGSRHPDESRIRSGPDSGVQASSWIPAFEAVL